MNTHGKQPAFDLLHNKITSGVHHMAVISDSRFTRYNGPYGRAAFWHLASSIAPIFGGIAGSGWVSPTAGTTSVTIQQSQQPFGVGFYSSGTPTENLVSQGPPVSNDDTIPFNFRRVSIPATATARFYPDKWYTAFGASNSAPIFNITQGPITSLKMRALCEGQSSGGFTTLRWTYPNTSNVSDVTYAALGVDDVCVVEHTKAVTVQDTDPAVGDGVAAQYRIAPISTGTSLLLYASQWLNGDALRGVTLTSLSAGGADLADMYTMQANAGSVLNAAGFGIVNIVSGANASTDYRAELIQLIDWLNAIITDQELLIFVHQSCYTPGVAHNAAIEGYEDTAAEVALLYDNVIACDTNSYLSDLGINSGADAWLANATDGLFQVDEIHFLDQAGQYYWADGVGQGIKDAAAKASIPNNRVMVDLANMITGTGTATPQFKADALALVPRVTVTPTTSSVQRETSFTRKQSFYGETPTISSTITDANGTAVDFTGITLVVAFEVVGTLTDIATATGTAASNTVSWVMPSAVANYSTNDTTFIYSIRDADTDQLYERGEHKLIYAALAD